MVELYQIYLITNLINNKKYVGQVLQRRGYLSRFTEHINGAKYANTRLLSTAIKKYGKEAFQVQLIECDIPESQIDKREQYYIKYYNTFYKDLFGYNMTAGGQGIHRYRHTEADKAKISQAGLHYWDILRSNPEKLAERNLKISQKLKGIPKSETARAKLSLAARQRFKEEPGTFTGKHHSEKTKQLIAEKNGIPIGMYDKKSDRLLQTFISCNAAGRYVLQQNLTTNKSAATRILTVCNGVKGQGISAYGYKWKFLDKSVSTIPAGSRADIATARSALSKDGE